MSSSLEIYCPTGPVELITSEVNIMNMFRLCLKRHGLLNVLSLLILLVVFTNTTFAQSTNLEGKWVVDSIVIQTTQKGEVVTFTSTAEKRMPSYRPQPISIVFYADTISIEYSENSIAQGTYQMNGNLLNIKMPEQPLTYRYDRLSTNKLKLEQTVEYWIDGIEPANEQYSIYLHK